MADSFTFGCHVRVCPASVDLLVISGNNAVGLCDYVQLVKTWFFHRFGE